MMHMFLLSRKNDQWKKYTFIYFNFTSVSFLLKYKCIVSRYEFVSLLYKQQVTFTSLTSIDNNNFFKLWLTWFYLLQDAPDVNLFSERSGKEGTLSFTATIKSNTPCNAQWYAKCKDGDTFMPIDVNDKEYRGTTNSLPHPMLVVKQMHHPENAIYQIKVTNFVDSTTKEIAGEVLIIELNAFFFIYYKSFDICNGFFLQ